MRQSNLTVKPIYKIIKLEVYPFDILFTTEQDPDKLTDYLKARIPDDCFDEISLVLDNDSQGTSVLFSCGATIIKINHISHNIIAHEIFHAVTYLLSHIGMSLSKKSDEAYAYLIGYVTEQIYAIPELKKQINKN